MIMERFTRLEKVGRDDLTSLNKVITWPQEKLKELTKGSPCI